MKKRTSFLLLALLMSATTFAQVKMTDGMKKVLSVLGAINNGYVEPVDDKKLAEDAVRALLNELDPHSNYLTAKEFEELTTPLQGNFSGIGIAFNMVSDTLYVSETVVGGPAAKVGLMAGDRIVKVNDTIVAGVKMPQQDITARLRGPEGTSVVVSVLRKGVLGLLDYKIVRGKIPVHSVDATYMATKNVGYIRISRFGETTHNELVEALKKLSKQGMKDLIIDLQGNGGGYLQAAVRIANEFLESGRRIVYTEGAKSARQSWTARGTGIFQKGRVVVLVDEASASASEVLSGALQDWDRGVIVGRRTFGKGLVQNITPLFDKSALRLTTAHYYTPAGRSIQKPYTKGKKKEYENELTDRMSRGELQSADSIHLSDSLKLKTLVAGRTIYGGGGIMPDVFVPLDTLRNNALVRDLWRKGVINQLAFRLVDESRADIKAKYATGEDFAKKYTLPADALDRVKKMAEAEKITVKDADFQRAKDVIITQVRALIGRELYGMDTLFRITNENDDIYRKGLQVIESKQYDMLLQGKK